MKPSIAAPVAISAVFRTPACRLTKITSILRMLSPSSLRSAGDTRHRNQGDQRLAKARPYSCESVAASRQIVGGSFLSLQNRQQSVATSTYYQGFGFPGTAAGGVDASAIRFRQTQQRSLTFTFAGPRRLDELMKKELLNGKTGTEIADIWYTYHEEKDNVEALVLSGKRGRTLLERAAQSPFFVQPVFRDDGFFMLLSQFQKPSHFLLAYLEDYKMDPHSATPLITFTVFDDYATSKDVCLVRCDIVNRSIRDDEGHRVVSELISNYLDEYGEVQTFNAKPKEFHIDDFISRMEQQWKDNVVDDNTTVDFHQDATETEEKKQN